MQPIPARIDFLRELRHLVAAQATELASNGGRSQRRRPLAEKLASEVLPLADALPVARAASGASSCTAALRKGRQAVLDAWDVV